MDFIIWNSINDLKVAIGIKWFGLWLFGERSLHRIVRYGFVHGSHLQCDVNIATDELGYGFSLCSLKDVCGGGLLATWCDLKESAAGECNVIFLLSLHCLKWCLCKVLYCQTFSVKGISKRGFVKDHSTPIRLDIIMYSHLDINALAHTAFLNRAQFTIRLLFHLNGEMVTSSTKLLTSSLNSLTYWPLHLTP